jgi:hypothetical protein
LHESTAKLLEQMVEQAYSCGFKTSFKPSQYIYFPRYIWSVFIALCILMFFLGTNYQNNLMLLLCYFLLALFLVNLLVSYSNFARIDLHIGKCPEVFVGDNLNIPLWLNTNKNGISPANGLLHFKFQTITHQTSKNIKKNIISQ